MPPPHRGDFQLCATQRQGAADQARLSTNKTSDSKLWPALSKSLQLLLSPAASRCQAPRQSNAVPAADRQDIPEIPTGVGQADKEVSRILMILVAGGSEARQGPLRNCWRFSHYTV